MVSQGILGTLFGTALGAILTFCTTNFNQWWQIRKQRRIATMQVVSNLRRWMREMAWRFDQTKLSVDSGGHAGSPHTEIPDFHFETSLEQISILRHTTATKLFNLIHEKDNANIEVKWRIEFGVSDFEADEVLDFFRGQSAALYLDAAELYNHMSQQVGWSAEPYFERYKVMMKEEIRRREENKGTIPLP